MGTRDIRVVDVPEPELVDQHDVIVRVTSTSICGSDLHLYNGFNPTMQRGDILGHEFMGEVVDIGAEVRTLRPGDRVVVPFPIACGKCFFCGRGLYSNCENSNPNAALAEKAWGHAPAAIFGYSHLTGGYAGGQAEYARVPYGDVGPVKVPSHLRDEEVLFLSDVFPTGYMAAEFCDIDEGDVIAVWGCGPVGQFAIRSALLLGAAKVIAIDAVATRLELARAQGCDEVLNYEQVDVLDALSELTGGHGPDACIDAVGLEANGNGLVGAYDRAKHASRLPTDRPTALRQALLACRNGGVVSVPGAYAGFADKIPLGAIMNKGLTIRSGQTPVQRYPVVCRLAKNHPSCLA